MTNKSIRDYINLIENLQREGVTEGKPGFDGTDAAGRPVDQELVKRQEKYWNQAAKEKKQQELKRSKELKKPGVAEGTEQVYKVVALDKGNALKKPTKMKVKASSIEDLFSRLSANDWYPLEINGVEVIAGKRLKQSVAEEQLEETSPDAVAKVEQLFRHK
jgi:hypothetical protein